MLFGSFFWSVAAQTDNFSLVMGCLVKNNYDSTKCMAPDGEPTWTGPLGSAVDPNAVVN